MEMLFNLINVIISMVICWGVYMGFRHIAMISSLLLATINVAKEFIL